MSFPRGSSSRLILEEDFVVVTSTAANLNWTVTASGTNAAGSIVTTGADADHLGVLQLTSGTTASGRATLHLGTANIVLGTRQVECEIVLQVPTLGDATQRFTVYAGLGDSTAAGESTDAIGFRYADNVNSGRWVAYCRSNGVESVINSSVAVAAGQWDRLRWRLASGGASVEFFIDDVSIGSISSNIPSGTARALAPLVKAEKTVGTTARTLLVDYYRLEVDGMVR